ncbi:MULTISPECIES: FAD:protein FMN transferase [unclassified Treponema]|uniref:FAD:protein FMN transferase n=1 Tax=unclassified Treponema TaxID=2638727 RepID=UPI0020A2A301|nr:MULTISPECIES: FAD:protein FMN transferase [unclassified Treponema]UTC66383.1 FAD:protein FMN transferase [Treponema sp. OMZ 789]UTC69113.1 FAD:protein FMN transferase [Treponema sp. OMZ 790]UTC71825.1 FAD:protein FMN transferase [Treponema sp. OMZ 791]
MRKYFIFLSFFLVLFLFSCKPVRTEYSKTWVSLGTVCRVRILTFESKKHADKVLEKVYAELTKLDNIFNANTDSLSAENNNLKGLTGIQESELERLNKAAGIFSLEVSPELYELLKTSLLFAELTDGAFNPAVGPLVKLWNIGFENQSVPSQEEINRVLPLLDYKNIELKTGNLVFLKKKGMRLDLGGIAKGYAADKIAKIILNHGIKDFLIDLGGNILASGKNPSDKTWKIALRNPLIGKNNSVVSMDLQDASIVTSGNYERFIKKDGIIYHHIFDSKTGYPVQNNLNASSIMSKSSAVADVLSTSSYALGEEKTKLLLQRLEPELLQLTGSSEIPACFLFYKDNSISILGNKNIEIIDPDFFIK